MWRYAPPAARRPGPRQPGHPRPRAHAADPGRRARRRELGLRAPLWVKDDSANPTHSFKDRVVSVALTAARGLGFTRFACASTGNLANSVAAHAARAGVPVHGLHPGRPGEGKVITTAVYGGDLVAIDGSYDDVNRLCSELTETDEFEKTAFVNVNLRPFYAEGSKTLGYEVAEQLGWRLPEQIVIPMASGELLTKVDKAFAELVEIGLVEAPANGWKVFGAQSAGLQPDRRRPARRRRRDHAGQADRHREVAQHRRPGVGPVRAGGGAAQRRLDGLRRRRRDPRRHPAAGPDHRRLRRDGRRRDRRGAPASWSRPAGWIPTAETVIFNTGEGLKTLDAVEGQVGPTYRIRPSLRAAREAQLMG